MNDEFADLDEVVERAREKSGPIARRAILNDH
jgi:hypothetical protein